MHFGLFSLCCEEKVLEDSKAVELTVWTRDGALVFQETFWQILRCDFFCSVHCLTFILFQSCATHENRCSHNYTRIWYPGTLSFFSSGALKCHSVMYWQDTSGLCRAIRVTQKQPLPQSVPCWSVTVDAPLTALLGGRRTSVVLLTVGKIRLYWLECQRLVNFCAQGVLWATLPNCPLMPVFVCFVFWKRRTI